MPELVYMLDTNICICIARHQPASVLGRLAATPPDTVCISAITYAELLYGAYKSQNISRNLEKLDRFAELISVLPFDSKSSKNYGEGRADLENRGLVIGGNDLLIAAHARGADLTLVTNHGKEFQHVDGLRVENWVESQM